MSQTFSSRPTLRARDRAELLKRSTSAIAIAADAEARARLAAGEETETVPEYREADGGFVPASKTRGEMKRELAAAMRAKIKSEEGRS